MEGKKGKFNFLRVILWGTLFIVEILNLKIRNKVNHL